MQQSFFGDDSPARLDVSVIIKKEAKLLSKNQQTFNRLTSRIKKIRLELETNSSKYAQIAALYATEIIPVIQQLGTEKIKLAHALAKKYNDVKLTAKQTEQVEGIIYALLEDAFTVVEPDAETEELYNRFSPVTYREELEEQKEDMKYELEEHLQNTFGININLDDFETEDPEVFARLEQQLKEQFEHQHVKQDKKKKTKKQEEKEQRMQQEAEIKKRSLRNIYMGLVKLLHPDRETDENLRRDKEEIMKQVTKAYNENDLPALLQLEMQWVAKENNHLDLLPDETLKIYISVLKEQLTELEREKLMLEHNPSFKGIDQYKFMKLNYATTEIAREKKERMEYVKDMQQDCQIILTTGRTRDAIRNCIEKYQVFLQNSEPDFDDLNKMMQMFMKQKGYR